MGEMNWKHIILGGLITALLFSLGFLNAVVFAPGWFGAESLGRSWEWNMGGSCAGVVVRGDGDRADLAVRSDSPPLRTGASDSCHRRLRHVANH